MRRPLRPAFFLVAVAIVAAGCTGSSQTPILPTVVVGLLTGTATGTDALHGGQLAIDVVNGAYPNIAGPLAKAIGLPDLSQAKLALATADTHADAGRVSDAASTLVHNGHASALVVAGGADVAAAAGSAAQGLSVPVVDAASSADYVADLGLDWYFRIGPSDQMLAETALSMVRRQVGGPARISLLTASGTASADVAAVVTDLGTRAGDTLAQARLSPTLTAHPDREPPRIDTSQCDVIFALADTPAQSADVMRMASSMTRPVPILALGTGFAAMNPSTDSMTLLRAVAWSAEFAQRSPPARRVMTAYQQRFGAAMTTAAAASFTATMTAAIAIETVGSADPARVRNALRRLSLPATEIIMPWNGLRFDASGQNELAAGVIEAQVGGQFKVVYPRELAVAPMIWTTGGPTP